MKIKHIFIELLEFKVTLIECDFPRAKKYLQSQISDWEMKSGMDGCVIYQVNQRHIFCWIDSEKKTIGHIFHECNHLVQRIFWRLQINTGIENTEMVSNMFEFLGPKMIEFYNNPGKTIIKPKFVKKSQKSGK